MSDQNPPVDVPASDEALHPPGPEPLWSESYYLDFVDAERGVGGYVRVALLPNLGRAWYWACLVGPDRPLVTVIDHDVPLPRTGLELRTEGLWADYNVETPLDHVSVGVEAFGVALDDPADTYGHLRGERVPLGLDLEWESEHAPYRYPGTDRYEVPCRVHGEVLVGREEIQVDGFGQRDHSWAARDWWGMSWSWHSGRLDDGTRFHGTRVEIDGTPLYGTGYLIEPRGPLVPTGTVAHSEQLGPHGFPTTASWQVADLEMTLEPVAFSPVLLAADDGRVARFPRAWCRVTTADGRTGHSWTEWNQPG